MISLMRPYVTSAATYKKALIEPR